MELQRSVNGALAGAVAAAVWAAQQPLDKRVFDVDYDDVELLGKLVSARPGWPAVGLALHVANGAAFGAAYASCARSCPARRSPRGDRRAWPRTSASGRSGRLVDRYHPARGELPTLAGNRRALAQATWRHVALRRRAGRARAAAQPEAEADEPPEVPVSSNGHGNIELAVGAATALDSAQLPE